MKILSYGQPNTAFTLLARHFISIMIVFISFLNNGKVHYAMPFEYREDKVFFDIILEAYKEP
jgi:hypothetical protein